MKAAALLTCILAGTLNAPYAHQQAPQPVRIPHITIQLPDTVPSDKLELRYFMTGGFGGYGDAVNKKPALQSYDIEAGVNGTVAKDVKIVAYAPGCAFMAWDISINDNSDQKKTFTCSQLGIVPFLAKITTSKYYKGKNAVVEVLYVSNFSDAFFHVADGMVTIFPVAQARLEPNGTFQVALPDFLKDPMATPFQFQGSTFRFVIRDPATGNIIANLQLKDSHYKNQETLQLASSYAGTVSFVEEAND